jgi:cell division protein FtsQ
MDGGGRFAQSLTSSGRVLSPVAGGTEKRQQRVRRERGERPYSASARSPDLGAFERKLNDWSAAIVALNLPRGFGVIATALIFLGSGLYGAVRGNHLPVVAANFDDARDALADAFGLGIETIALSGLQQLTRDQVLAAAGVTTTRSLLFFDVTAARKQLQANPWIADATVQKLYPDRLQITITERRPFALWQHNRVVSVISPEGTVLEPFTGQRFTNLPLVVGEGAQLRANDFLALLDRYPEIRSLVRACILVAERRWNLRLNDGIDVLLPEADVAHSLDRLTAFNRDHKLLARDVTAIDLRLPDRVTVHLSDTAAQAREEAIKTKKPKTKGDAA